MFSPGYAAKEVAASNSYSSRSDLFALGVVLYELIAGVHPYAAPTPAERQSLILAGGRAKALLARNPQVPREMSQLVARLLSPRIAERPASATDVARQLREASISPAQLVSDVALGVRMGNRGAKLLDAHLGDAWIDLLVAEARQLPSGFNGANWREMGPALLIDPCTDRIAAGEATPTFLRRVAVWGWAPGEISSALVNGGADDETTAYILAWQMGHSVSGLITPYLRIASFDATGSSGLRRTLDLARASMRARTKEGWREPLLVGVAVAGAIVTDGQRRDEILASLTELDVDGFYVVLEARGSEEGYLRACREFGETVASLSWRMLVRNSSPCWPAGPGTSQ